MPSLAVCRATLVEGDPKAPFSIATTPRCRGGHCSFLWIAPFYPWFLPLLLSVKQGGIKYHFFSLWYDDLGLNPGLLGHGWTLYHANVRYSLFGLLLGLNLHSEALSHQTSYPLCHVSLLDKKAAFGHIGQNIMSIRFKMRSIIWIFLVIRIIKLLLRNLDKQPWGVYWKKLNDTRQIDMLLKSNLMTPQPILGYFMPRGLGITLIVYLYLHFLGWLLLCSFFVHSHMISSISIKYN